MSLKAGTSVVENKKKNKNKKITTNLASLVRWQVHDRRSVWYKAVVVELTVVDRCMLSWSGEHDHGTKLHLVDGAVKLFVALETDWPEQGRKQKKRPLARLEKTQ